MEVIVLALTAAFAVWFFMALRYHDIVLGTAIFLTITSVFSSDFVGVDIGGAKLTIDRAWMLCLAIQFFYNWKMGLIQWRKMRSADMFLAAFLGWLIIRTLMHPLAPQLKEQPSTLLHLLNGYIVPAGIYWLIRFSRVDPARLNPAIVTLLLFGTYLSLTAVFEITKTWSLVFPAYIADPTLGIHYGRARGPMLQSVRLGMCLNLCLALLWTSVWWLYPKSKAAWLLTLSLTPLLLLAILLTYTRSIWMATAAIVVISMLTLLRGKTRWVAIGGLFVCTTVSALIVGPNLVAFKREYSEAETRESTYMRAAFAYVSWQMFQDKPIAGFGFNQFQVYDKPYLDDRSTNIRLESIRGYVHHNSFLSILVDLGLVGAVLYGLATLAFLRGLFQLWYNSEAPRWAHALASLAFCTIAVHAIQMAFHEVSFSTIENSLLAMVLGLAQCCRDDFRGNAPTVAVNRQPTQQIYYPTTQTDPPYASI